jgi:RPA family protein
MDILSEINFIHSTFGISPLEKVSLRMKRRKMEGAVRLFAREFQQAIRPLGDEGVLSPFGLPCRLVFISGALTELERRGPDRWTGRVADPSGVFSFSADRADSRLRKTLGDLSPPAFVTLLARARPGSGKAPAQPILGLLEIGPTERDIRDLWVIRTAELTTERLLTMLNALRSGTTDPYIATALSQYRTTEPDLKEMAEVVRRALTGVAGSSGDAVAEGDIREKVLAIIRESAGKSGIALDEIIEAAGRSGIDSTRARDAVRALVEEDECYQPSKGIFKPL